MECRSTGRSRRQGRRTGLVSLALCLSCAAGTLLPVSAAGQWPVRGRALVAGRPAANAAVWLEGGDAPRVAAAKRVVLDQRNLQFSPQLLVVRVGTPVVFPNSDRVFHNVFSFHHGKVFDLGLYPVGESKVVHFDRPGVSRIFCNIHPNMAAYVVAVDSPYFAVSDASGAFVIPDVPPGRYTHRAWRPGGADVSGTWTVSAETAPLVVEWPK